MRVTSGIYLKHCANLLFGMYQRPFSEEWDSMLNELLDSGTVVDCSSCVITFKYREEMITVWCENKWYSFGHIARVNDKWVDEERQYRPRIKTMVKLWSMYRTERDRRLDSDFAKLFKGGAA